jgi:site-specific DNA-methyltransferase (adenine-specific)/modification methylase
MKKHFTKIQNSDFLADKDALLLNGDCVENMGTIPDSSVSLLLTDPPYNLGLFMKGRGTNMGKLRENHFAVSGWDQLETSAWTAKMDEFFMAASRVMKERGAMIVFMSLIKVQSIIELAVKHGFYYKTTGVWHKKNPMPRNMNLQFVNSTEAWLYFTYGADTGTFNNEGRVVCVARRTR